MASHSQRLTVLNDYAEQLIQIKARQLARRSDFRWSERDDLAQEMRQQLLRRAPLFDPQRASLNTFVACVIDSWIASLLRDRRRPGRAAIRCACSLEGSQLTGDGDHAPRRDALGADPGPSPDDEAARRELIALVAQVVDDLPDALQAICRRLPDQCPAQIKRELGLSRREFDAALGSIRRAFADARLGDR